jgi:hypothetical protein
VWVRDWILSTILSIFDTFYLDISVPSAICSTNTCTCTEKLYLVQCTSTLHEATFPHTMESSSSSVELTNSSFNADWSVHLVRTFIFSLQLIWKLTTLMKEINSNREKSKIFTCCLSALWISRGYMLILASVIRC